MADKIVEVVANPVYDSVVTEEKTASISTNEIISGLPQTIEYTGTSNIDGYSAIYRGFGEDSLVSPSFFTRGIELVNISDYFILNLNKPFVEIEQISDVFQSQVAFNRLFEEQNLITDQFFITVNFKRIFNDLIDATDDFFGNANIDDDQTAAITKVLREYNLVSDFSNIILNLNKFEELTGSLESNQKLIKPNKIETLGLIDTFAKSFQKPVSETITNSFIERKEIQPNKLEQINLFDLNQTLLTINKGLIDLFTSTDDFFGNANVDDDQTASVSKVLRTTQTIVDSLSRVAEYHRSYADSFSNFDVTSAYLDINYNESLIVLDQIFKAVIFKGQPDSAVALDSSNITTLRPLTDSISHADAINYQVELNKEEQLNAIDIFVSLAQYYRSILELLSIAEESRIQSNLLKADNVLNTDLLNRVVEYNRQPNESQNISEITSFSIDTKLENQTSIASDSPSISPNKRLFDQFTRSDSITNVNILKALQDIPFTTDSLSYEKFATRIFLESISIGNPGFANNQSYFSEDYVEPGYIGTNRYFN